MRVLIAITRGDSIGGAQLYVRTLASRLQADQHDVLVVVGTVGTLTMLLEDDGIPVVACPSLRRQLHPLQDPKAVRDLGRIIQAFRPDIVSTHSSKAGVIGRLASLVSGVPCVFTAHGWAFADGVPQPGRALWRVVERLTAPLAARIICVSEFDRNLAIRNGIDATRLRTIHNGIPDDTIPLRGKRDPERPVRIAMVARFSPQKDQPSLLRAIQHLPQCELDLVGDGPLEDSVKVLAHRLDIQHRVHFHGYRPDVDQVLANADIFVLASHYEGFPLTTLEAMRAGLPTIVSDVGGAAEAMIPDVTGFVVPPGDHCALRSRIQQLTDDPGLMEEMGRSAQAAFKRSFTFERMYRETLAVYEDVLSGNANLPAPEHFRAVVALARQGRRLGRSIAWD